MTRLLHYLSNSSITILRAYTLYRPLRVFLLLGGVSILGGLLIGARFLYFYWVGNSRWSYPIAHFGRYFVNRRLPGGADWGGG